MMVPAGRPIVGVETCTLTEEGFVGLALKIAARARLFALPAEFVVSVPFPLASWVRYVQPATGAPVAAQVPTCTCHRYTVPAARLRTCRLTLLIFLPSTSWAVPATVATPAVV